MVGNTTDVAAIASMALIAIAALLGNKEHGHTIALAILPLIAQVAVVKRALYAPPPVNEHGKPTTIPPAPKSATGLMLAPILLLASWFATWRNS